MDSIRFRGTPVADSAGIHAVVAALEQAWNAHNAEAWTDMFLPDANFTNVFGIETIGRDAILRTHRHIMATMFRDSSTRMNVTSLRFVRPDVASVTIRWTMHGASDVHGKPWPDRDGLMALVMTMEADGWRVAVLHNMDVPKAERVASFRNDLAAQMR